VCASKALAALDLKGLRAIGWTRQQINARLEGFKGLFQAGRVRVRRYRNVENFITMVLPDCSPDSGRGGIMNSSTNVEEIF